MTTVQLAEKARQDEAKRFLDFVDDVAISLYACVYSDCTSSQRALVLSEVERLHIPPEIN